MKNNAFGLAGASGDTVALSLDMRAYVFYTRAAAYLSPQPSNSYQQSVHSKCYIPYSTIIFFFTDVNVVVVMGKRALFASRLGNGGLREAT